MMTSDVAKVPAGPLAGHIGLQGHMAAPRGGGGETRGQGREEEGASAGAPSHLNVLIRSTILCCEECGTLAFILSFMLLSSSKKIRYLAHIFSIE